MLRNHQRIPSASSPVPEHSPETPTSPAYSASASYGGSRNTISTGCDSLPNRSEHRPHPTLLQRKPAENLQRRKILPKRRNRRTSILGKPHMRRPPAQSLDPHRSCTRIQIHKPAPRNTRRKHIEQRLPQTIARRPRLPTLRSHQRTRTVTPCNHSHRLSLSARISPAHTMISMRGWSFPIGRFLGVDLRIHTFFLLLLGVAISYSSVSGSTGGRGFVLWLLLVCSPSSSAR